MADINADTFEDADTFEVVETPNQASQAVEIADNKISPILTSMKDSVAEGLKATSSYGFSLFSSVNALIAGVGAAFATAKALGNLGKLAFYDTTRIAANTLYYQDEKATEAAKKDADESLAEGCKEMEAACQQTIATLSMLKDATLHTVEGLHHTQNSLCFAWNAASRVRDAAYDLFAANNEPVEIECEDMQRLLIS
ncbi:MAG TPA: hypothetical protein VGU44_02560 [Gammaproteobacteria bacterium]|nr:hypothetical protein [Gammaproteobacteria bacterium]